MSFARVALQAGLELLNILYVAWFWLDLRDGMKQA
jgi:hypothetical protein